MLAGSMDVPALTVNIFERPLTELTITRQALQANDQSILLRCLCVYVIRKTSTSSITNTHWYSQNYSQTCYDHYFRT
jgi:hypothetical protein